MILDYYKKMIKSLYPDNLQKQLETEKGTIIDGVKYLLLSSLVVDVLWLVIGLIFFLVIKIQMDMEKATIRNILPQDVITTFGEIFILLPIVVVIFALIWNGIMFLLCKLLGGKGKYNDQFYHFAIITSGIMLIMAIANTILVLTPCLPYLVLFIGNLYFMYLSFLIYKKLHELDNARAAFVALLPLLLEILLFVIMSFAVVTIKQQGLSALQ